MKITIEHYDEVITIQTKADDLDTAQVTSLIARCLLGAGYSQENVYEYIKEM